jgi:molybdopterin-guanine dinucleotide biosynthesis protein A
VAAALSAGGAAGDELAVVAPCDLPDLTALVVEQMLAPGGPCIAVADGREHPLLAVLPVSMAETAAALAAQAAPVRALVKGIARVEVPAGAVRNVNRM